MLALTLAAALFPSTVPARVYLIGVDGASWNVIDPMMAAGQLPQLARLAADGVTAELETVEPVRSPVVWTSIATGRSPAAHGIVDFFATRLSIRVPSSFERISQNGARVGLYDYLVTWPPAQLAGGFVIPGWLRRDPSVTPIDLWQRLGRVGFVNSYDGAFTSRDYLERAGQELDHKAKLWIELAERFDIDIGALTFYAPDMTSHRYWEAGFPDDFEEPDRDYRAEERTAIVDAMRGIDRSIGQIAASLAADDTILIASDHGFEADSTGGRDVWVTDLEAALRAAELVPQRDGFRVVGTFGAVALRVLPGELQTRDDVTQRLFDVLSSFRTAAGEPLFSRIEAVDVAERPPNARRPLSVRFRQWVVRLTAEWFFDVSFESIAHAVVFALPAQETLAAAWPDAIVQVGDSQVRLDSVIHRQRFTGIHDPTAVFIAAGGPIVKRTERDRISVLDISPLLFYLAGQAIPDDLEGRLPLEWIETEHRSEHPPRSAPADSSARLIESEAHGVTDPALIEKLRSLGYIE
jgi:hypothetical protein